MSDDDAAHVGHLASQMVRIIECRSLIEARIVARDALETLLDEDFDDPEGLAFLRLVVRSFDAKLAQEATA